MISALWLLPAVMAAGSLGALMMAVIGGGRRGSVVEDAVEPVDACGGMLAFYEKRAEVDAKWRRYTVSGEVRK